MKSMIKTVQEEKWFLLGIFFCALIIRLLYFDIFLRDNPCMLMFDSGQYHELATQIADGHGLNKPDGSPQFYRLPGYSLFLGICYKIFDFFNVNNKVLITLLIQIVLASIIPLLLFLLSLRLFPYDLRAAKISALIGCVHHGLVIYSGLIMTETLFMLFFLLFLCMFFKIPETRKTIVCAGMLLGCVSMIRSVGLVLLLVSVMVMVWRIIFFERKNESVAWIPGQARDDVGSKSSNNQLYQRGQNLTSVIPGSTGDPGKTHHISLRNIMFFIFGWFLVLSLWLVRNYMLTGYIFLDTLSGAHLLNHQAVPVLMKAENLTHAQAKEKIYALFEDQKRAQEIIKKRSLQEIELARIASTITIDLGIRYPCVTIKHTIFNMFKTCCSLYAAELLVIDSGGKLPDYDNNRGIGSMLKRYLMPDVSNKFIGYVIIYELIIYFFIVLGFLGALCIIRDHKFINFFCTNILFFMLALLGITFACGFARLRLPLSPFFIIVTSRFWSLIMKKRVTRE